MKNKRTQFGLLLALTGVIGVAYLPTFFSAFNGDDFDYLRILVFNSRGLVVGDAAAWDEWFLRSITGYVYLRPFVSALALVDFIIGNVAPFGYHFVGIVIHLFATFAAYWVARNLLRDKFAARFAAFFFALLPIHMSAVAWFAARNDVLCALWFLLALFFFMRYRRDGARGNYFWSLGAFILALFSKELAVTLPAIILLYDALYYPRDLLRVPARMRRHAAYWIILAAYFPVRFFFLGKIAARGVEYLGEGLWGWIDALIRYSLFPLVSDVTAEMRWLALAAIGIGLIIFRARREFLFGLLWTPLTYFLTISTNPSDYSFYLPSYGVTLLAAWLASRARFLRFEISLRARAALAALFLLASGLATFLWAQEYQRATLVAQTITQQVQAYYPALAPDARLVFVGVPDRLPNDVIVYLAGFGSAVQVAYLNPNLSVQRYDKFPVLLDKLDKTFFFLVDHRRVFKREDIARDLDARRRCANAQTIARTFDFARDAQGWEAWNQLADFSARDGTLYMRAEGNDPYLGSPALNVSSFNLGDVEIVMRAQSEQKQLRGSFNPIFFLTSNKNF
ncbi:MAG: hypothetical protein HY257_03630 [Chloroflexi bacterium]|nr:hypothetical protein [Chloroflexota bacterium]